LLDTGVLTAAELDARTAEFATGLYDEHEHYETTSDAIASLTRSPHTSSVRNIVWRADGEPINVFRRPGQLFVCATGCCCGHTERGHAPVPEALYHTEWARRRIRHKVHLSMGGCLGPCALSNVVLLLFAGREIWFHSVTGDDQVIAIFDYIEAMVRAECYLPPPPALAPQIFDVFDWANQSTASHAEDSARREVLAVAASAE
jgi:cobaltochelatase CobN